jgi:hypothetical protein
LRVQSVQLLGSRSAEGGNAGGGYQPQASAAQTMDAPSVSNDVVDDLPF